MHISRSVLFLLTLTFSCQTKSHQEAGNEKTGAAIQQDSASSLTKRPGPDAPRSAADRLVRALYFEHNVKENPLREKKDRSLIDQFFAKPTADLIWNDAQRGTGKINRAKINLLFNASDEAVKKIWVEPAAVGDTRAIVYVTFQQNGNPVELKVDLLQVSGRWRITDIIYPDGKQLTTLVE
ncbi:YqhG/Tai3 family protein [Spirosoma terrae]|uniref:DUF3828 domain-containing protein n=1 Tax=Spirosoma terrae TaxID=1968276 RepID=A0A6L9KYT8_9BACT|nr:hypothetical protein [Spirosoma terrae]